MKKIRIFEKILYIAAILNINSFKRLNGGRALTKSQLKLLGLKKIKLTSAQADEGIIKTMCEGIKY